MFDLNSYWFWIAASLVAITALLGWYRTKNLPPKQKELSKLFYSFGIFQIIIWYAIFNLLTFKLPFLGDLTTVPENINSLEETRKVLQNHNALLKELRETLSGFTGIVFFLGIAFINLVLQPIYNFAKAITPDDNEKILDLNIKERKSIFGLNDE